MGGQEERVAAWVKQLNKLARKMDETALNLHPSAWPEALRADRERYAELAKRGPR